MLVPSGGFLAKGRRWQEGTKIRRWLGRIGLAGGSDGEFRFPTESQDARVPPRLLLPSESLDVEAPQEY